MDAHCYHQGALLEDASIEDLPGGGACLRCPAHGRRIALDTGSEVSRSVDGSLAPNGVRVQRVHAVTRSRDGYLVVEPSSSPPAVRSDAYCCALVGEPSTARGLWRHAVSLRPLTLSRRPN